MCLIFNFSIFIKNRMQNSFIIKLIEYSNFLKVIFPYKYYLKNFENNTIITEVKFILCKNENH